ncbi:MAG: PEGA domain-containing protein [Deltaproteobacteria bacterium]|nr:PEGA domain-containing protein [Deltaproteobacteria bacterium]
MTLLPLFVLVAEATAGSLPEVAVVGLHVPGLDPVGSVEASGRVGDALTDTHGVGVLEASDVAARIQGREDLVLSAAFQGRGRALLEEGRVLYERADPEQAVPVLSEAIERLLDGMPFATDGRPLVEALLLSGFAHLLAGDEPAAREAFARAVVLDPGRELDPVHHAPRIVDLHGAVRQEVLSAGVGSVEVVTDDPGADVYVDGRRAGATPVTVEGLPAGSHALLVVGGRGTRWFDWIPIEAERCFATRVSPERAILAATPAVEGRDRARQTEDLYRALGEHLDVDAILVGGIDDRGEMALQLYAPRSRTFSRILSRVPGEDPAAAAVSLAPGLVESFTSTGDLRGDRVSPQVLPLDTAANLVLRDLLLDTEPPPVILTAAPVERMRFEPPPWLLWGGAGLLGAGALAAGGVWLFSGGDGGTLSVGPIP